MSKFIPIVEQIEEAVQTIPGWSPLDQLFSLYTLAYTSSGLSGNILELGSWCGRSAVVLGMAARLAGNGKVYCVDLFPEKSDWYKNTDGSYSFAVHIEDKRIPAYFEQTVWAEPYERDIVPVYQKYNGVMDAFSESIAVNELVDWVTPIKGTLETFSQNISDDFSLRMAFIDGDHSYDAVKNDIKIVEKFLLPGGWICFDDAFTSYEGVDEAIKELIIESKKYDHCQQLTRKLFVARKRS